MIRRENGKFVVCSEDGKSMGTYDTKREAEQRLAQIEMHKAMDEHKQRKG